MNSSYNPVSNNAPVEKSKFRNFIRIMQYCSVLTVVLLALGVLGVIVFGHNITQTEKTNDVLVTFVISEGFVEPDNFRQKGILINGMFPGPPLIVNKGDSLIIEVRNYLTSGFTLHLHGILQKGDTQ